MLPEKVTTALKVLRESAINNSTHRDEIKAKALLDFVECHFNIQILILNAVQCLVSNNKNTTSAGADGSGFGDSNSKGNTISSIGTTILGGGAI